MFVLIMRTQSAITAESHMQAIAGGRWRGGLMECTRKIVRLKIPPNGNEGRAIVLHN